MAVDPCLNLPETAQKVATEPKMKSRQATDLPRPNCDSDAKAENMRQRTVVWLTYHHSECQEEVIFVNFPCASEIVSLQGVSVDPPECVALARRVVFIYVTPVSYTHLTLPTIYSV